jgi:hypothetical protein
MRSMGPPVKPGRESTPQKCEAMASPIRAASMSTNAMPEAYA